MEQNQNKKHKYRKKDYKIKKIQLKSLMSTKSQIMCYWKTPLSAKYTLPKVSKLNIKSVNDDNNNKHLPFAE